MVLKIKLVEKYSTLYNDKCKLDRVSTSLSKNVEKDNEKVLEDFFNIIHHCELENIEEIQPIKESIFFIGMRNLFGIDKDTKFTIFSLNRRKTKIKSLKLVNKKKNEISHESDYDIVFLNL